MSGTVHIIGAGLAGLSAAVRLTSRGRNVVVHEATAFAGGRCRSYHDAAVGMTIDNGNHLLLSGNRAALDYLRSIGAEASADRSGYGRVFLCRSGERRALDAAVQQWPIAILDFRSRAARARHARARLSATGAAALGAGRQGGERGHRVPGQSLSKIGRAAAARGAEYRCPTGIGAACGSDHSRDSRRRRAGVPPADRARRFGFDAG